MALGFTLLAVAWLIASGQQVGSTPSGDGSESEELRRSHVEAAFATNAFIFFCGWGWVVVLRDVTALSWLVLTALTGTVATTATATARTSG